MHVAVIEVSEIVVFAGKQAVSHNWLSAVLSSQI